MNLIEKLAQEFHLKLDQVESTVKLIEDGNTIPFIARYRKEATGGLSDEVLRDLDERLIYLQNLEERKLEVTKLIEEQGKLTPELAEEIQKAEVLQRVEDLYKPYKQKKRTRASIAKERGLEPLADLIWAMDTKSGEPLELAAPYINAELGVETAADALAGALDILAERIADDPELTALVRERTQKSGTIVTEASEPEVSTVYDMYYEYSEAIEKIPNHRILAINRGEKDKKLKVKVRVDVESMVKSIGRQVVKGESIFTEKLWETVEDAYKRLMAPSIEREMRNLLTERAERDAVKVFAKNTEKLLMQPPVKGARVIAIDPGYRTGCKVAVLNETGKIVAYTTIYPTEPKNDIAGTERVLMKLIEKYHCNVIVIGNGTGSRETEKVVAEFIQKSGLNISYTIVNEAGASIYSASKLATEEYPDLDVTTRGALSIGRRLQDPLAELVKIDPKHIGVGQYQHDIDQNLLNSALTNVVEDCVNRVGVDLNTASPSLLQYIAGINSAIAKNIVAYREEKGRFESRKELMKVPKLGEKTFDQCAGFMRISDGKDPLDATAVHPESYHVAEQMLAKLGVSKADIAKGGVSTIEDKIVALYPAEKKKLPSGGHGLSALAVLLDADLDKTSEVRHGIEKLSQDLGVGTMTLSDIISEIKKPGRDPREGMPPVVFRKDVLSFEDLLVGMELTGTVRNVVDFGAFVDIGVKNDGLVHISEMSGNFIKHPMDAVSVGDTVKVRILGVDHKKKKISLTMKLNQ